MINAPLIKAIEKCGSQAALAAAIGVTPMTITHWKRRGVPASRVLAVEAATGVHRSDLRPDIYPAEQGGEAA